MTIDYKIILGKKISAREYSNIEDTIYATFDEVHALYNKFNPHSEISYLNNLPAKKIVPLSAKLETLLIKADAIVKITKGKFDPTVEPLQKLWKSKLTFREEPTNEEIEALRPAIGWPKLHFGNGKFYKDHDMTQVDLGGIAKGYAVDLLVERLLAAGYLDVFVEWGGEIRAMGRHPDNRPWKIFISHLGSQDPKEAIASLELHNQAIATSGDYMQFWTVPSSGKTYTHIFDSQTLRPLLITPNSIASASVLAPDCTFADGIAKVGLFFSSLEEAQDWADDLKIQYPECSFWFVTREKIKNREIEVKIAH